MPKGISLHIGLNRVDPSAYSGWAGQLTACEFDAQDMVVLARKQGFETHQLLSSHATRASVISAIESAAAQLKKGDTYFLTYSGHGGQVPDGNGDEPDAQDETWVLFDGQLVDDELWSQFAKFAAGVRITVLSDSCHSGTVTRSMPIYQGISGVAGLPTGARFRAMPMEIRRKTYRAHRKLYDDIQKNNRKGDTVTVKASVILISGCQDNQLSLDGDRNGLFTEKVKKVWNAGKFKGSNKQFRNKVAALLPPTQTPNYLLSGARDPNFTRQRPFTL